MIFERKRNGDSWDNTIAPQFLKNEDGQFLKFLIDGTPTKGTFLSEYIKRNGKGIDAIRSARKWFENLNIIFPNTHRTDFPFRVVNDTQFRTVMRELLNYFGTGISDLRRIESKSEELGIPDEIRQKIEESLDGKDKKTGVVIHNESRFVFAEKDESKNLKWYELETIHKAEGSNSDYIFEIVEAFENTEVEGKKIPLKVSAGAIFMEPYMKETNAVRSRLTYALNHSRLEHHGELVIFNDEVCGSDENQFELIGVIHQCATHNFEGFRMFYQPIADTRTGKIRGMEALLRWELEPYGMVSPGVFMEWLEQDPCIFDLGNWILRTALTDVQKLRKETEGFFVNVNVAAAQLERREFRSAVMNILKETGARPEELCLELTERCRDLDIHFLRGEVEFFHSQGIKIALDDFGTGNSSLSLALELPFDELKVDMSFIRDIKQKPQNQAMVQSIVDYARRTNTETCIEGIENKEVSDYIEKFGSTWQQGYYYSKPVPIEQFEEVLREKSTEKE